MNIGRLTRFAVVAVGIAVPTGCCKSKSTDDKGATDDKGSTTTRGGSVDPKTAALLATLGKAVGCPSTTAGHRDFCIATDGWAGGTVGELPVGNQVFGGLVIPVVNGKTPNPANDIKPAMLVMRGDASARFGKIITPTPDSPEEAKGIAAFVFNVSTVFKGRTAQAEVASDLYDYAVGQAAKASYSLTKGTTGWMLASKTPTEIRHVGTHWVAIEQDPAGRGIYVNVLTDKLVRK